MKIVDQYGRKIVTFGRADVRVASQKVVDVTNDGLGGQLDVMNPDGTIIRVHAPSSGVYIVNADNHGIAMYGGSIAGTSLTLQDQGITGSIELNLGALSMTILESENYSEPTGLYGYGALTMLGIQVVGPQQDAVDDADSGTIVAQFNSLLEKLRNHGLIAPSGS
jgi:hypothetical protein